MQMKEKRTDTNYGQGKERKLTLTQSKNKGDCTLYIKVFNYKITSIIK